MSNESEKLENEQTTTSDYTLPEYIETIDIEVDDSGFTSRAAAIYYGAHDIEYILTPSLELVKLMFDGTASCAIITEGKEKLDLLLGNGDSLPVEYMSDGLIEYCNQLADESRGGSEPQYACDILSSSELIDEIIRVNLEAILDGNAKQAFAPVQLIELTQLKEMLLTQNRIFKND